MNNLDNDATSSGSLLAFGLLQFSQQGIRLATCTLRIGYLDFGRKCSIVIPPFNDPSQNGHVIFADCISKSLEL